MNAAFEKAFLERMETLHNGIKRAFHGLPQEAMDWAPGPEMNSISVLVAHTTGAERFWIGDVAMGEGSGRNREAEFHVSGMDEAALKARLDETLAYAQNALPRLPENSLDREVFAPDRNERVTVAWALLHALEHLGIHLGHIQMVRQLWDERKP